MMVVNTDAILDQILESNTPGTTQELPKRHRTKNHPFQAFNWKRINSARILSSFRLTPLRRKFRPEDHSEK
jgi:hypothetical protein